MGEVGVVDRQAIFVSCQAIHLNCLRLQVNQYKYKSMKNCIVDCSMFADIVCILESTWVLLISNYIHQ